MVGTKAEQVVANNVQVDSSEDAHNGNHGSEIEKRQTEESSNNHISEKQSSIIMLTTN